MSFEIIDLCKFYFNMTDLNDNKACNQSNQVRFGFLWGRERKSAGSFEDQPWSFPVECQGTIPLRKFWRKWERKLDQHPLQARNLQLNPKTCQNACEIRLIHKQIFQNSMHINSVKHVEYRYLNMHQKERDG